MFEKTEAQVLDFISMNDRNDNLLFTDVSDATMTSIKNYLAQSEVKNKGYLLIDLTQEEVKHIEEMIVNTDNALGSVNTQYIKTKISEIQKGIEELEAVMKSNPALSGTLSKSKSDLVRKIRELENSLVGDTKQDELRRFLILSAIAEEYVIGKIAKEIVKVPKLKESCKIEDIDAKLQYFDEFMQKDGISPEEYEDFNNKRFAIIIDGLLYLLQRNEESITCCFTDFQNISNPLINRVVNNFTAYNTNKFRTMILTTDTYMLTRQCRDEGIVEEPYEFRAYTLDKTKRPKPRF